MDKHRFSCVCGVATVLTSLTAAQVQPDDLEYTFSPSLDVVTAWTSQGSSSFRYAVDVVTAQQTYTVHTNNSSLLLHLIPPNTTVSVLVHPYLPLLDAPGMIWGASIGATSAPMACPPRWGINQSSAACAPCPAGTFNSDWLHWTVDSACEVCPSYSWSQASVRLESGQIPMPNASQRPDSIQLKCV